MRMRKVWWMMAERPILFSGEMVQAILDGRKTQTRRVVKNQKYLLEADFAEISGDLWKIGMLANNKGWYQLFRCPYGEPGDKLWVRETFTSSKETDKVVYKADVPDHIHSAVRWHPSIFMPRWASRITLEIVNIRVERIQSISGQDCFREGIDGKFLAYPEASQEALLELATSQIRDRFMLLWDSINAKRGLGWDVNPWVWVIDFQMAAKTPSEPNEAK